MKITIAKYYIPSGRCIQAVDYSNRNPDGSVGQIPDSLKVEFKTKNGRVVYDGGGLDPEVEIKKEKSSDLARKLDFGGFIFRYASQYALEHASINSADNFDLTEEEYQDFVEWTIENDFIYSNPLIKELNKLESSAQELNQEELSQVYIAEMRNTLERPVSALMISNKDEIKRMLEEEIAARYYLQPGAVKAGLGDDPCVQKAIEILSSPEQYQGLLAPVR